MRWNEMKEEGITKKKDVMTEKKLNDKNKDGMTISDS